MSRCTWISGLLSELGNGSNLAAMGRIIAFQCSWAIVPKKHDTQVEVKKRNVFIVNIANTYEGMQQFLNLKQVTYLHVLNVLESHSHTSQS